jgi:high affinity Mn2+ porin
MPAQLARRFRAPIRFEIDSFACALSAFVMIGLLPTLGEAQSLSPTPQPESVPITSEQSEEVTPENWAIHGQATFTPMFQPAFRSSTQGPLSLSSAANGRETADATLYLGFRPWQGAEIWINPEMDQGFGLGNTTGVAGFVSGEAYKVGEADP